MKIKLALTVLMLMGLNGCGFHLPNQGSLSSSVAKINVSGSYHSPFYKKVVQQLEIAGVQVNAQSSGHEVDDKDSSIPVLLLPNPSVSVPVASVDAHANALEYNIIVSTSATLKIPNHRPIVMRNSLTRSFMYKSGNSLASSNERSIVIDEAFDELARQMTARINYLGRQSDPDASAPTPAELTTSEGETLPISTIGQNAERMTLLEALQHQDAIEKGEASSVTLDDLNNGQKVLNSSPRSYSLPKQPAPFVNAAPDSLSEEGFGNQDQK